MNIRTPLRPNEDDVCRFIAIFRNGYSASGYIAALRFACIFNRVGCASWDTPSVKQVLSGLKKITVRKEGTAGLKWKEVIQIRALAWIQGEFEFATMIVLACNFLFRVPNELVPLRWHSYDAHSKVDLLFVTPMGHSRDVTAEVLMSDKEVDANVVQISLKSRKNCRNGSVLTRKCVCKINVTGRTQHPLCPVHALLEFVKLRKQSPRGFQRAPQTILNRIVYTNG